MTLLSDDVRESDARPSARLVYVVLDQQGPMTLSELVDETGLHRNSVRNALDDLESVGTIDVTPWWDDNRQTRYDLAD